MPDIIVGNRDTLPTLEEILAESIKQTRDSNDLIVGLLKELIQEVKEITDR